MNIKYLNVCLDKKQFTDIIVDKLMPKMTYKEKLVVNDKILRNILVMSIFMTVSWAGLLFIEKGRNPSTWCIVIMWTIKALYDYHYRKENRRNKIQNDFCKKSIEIMNACNEGVKNDVTFEEIVAEPEFGNIDEVCRTLWIIYNTTIHNVKFEDNCVTIYYEYKGVESNTVISQFYDKGLTEFNTLSVTKDGIFLGMNDDVLRHAIKSIILKNDSEIVPES